VIRVLIVDNNVELCRTIEYYLNSIGDIEVCGVAYDGEEALKLIPEVEPDVVVLDITMPHLDGMAVLERLETLHLQRWPRIIMLTALSRDDLIQRFTELGADYYIVKPFDLDLLADRIRQFSVQNGKENIPKRVVNNQQDHSGADDEVNITRLLQEMGIPAHFKGYNYLRDAVCLVVQNENMLGGALTKTLYPQLAEKYSSTPGGVEAAIRNAVLAAWESGNREFIQRLSGNGSRKGRFPTNSMVIAKLANELRLQSGVV